MRFIELNNGIEMPVLGLGTWKSRETEVYRAVRWALKIGYQLFDCASIYNNESAIGEAFEGAFVEDNLKREDIFVTSKLWNNAHKPEDVIPALKASLKDLRLDYLDLYLIHWPVAQIKTAIMPLEADDMLSLEKVPLEETWGAMEEAYKQGLVKAIGVSNFGKKRLERFFEKVEINPMVNQVECHPYFPQEELSAYCQKNMIAMTAYAPLGSGSPLMFEDEKVKEIALKNKATPAQVLLAWGIAKGMSVIPQAISEDHLRENFAALTVKLDEEDMEELSHLNKNERFLSADVFKLGAYAHEDVFS